MQAVEAAPSGIAALPAQIGELLREVLRTRASVRPRNQLLDRNAIALSNLKLASFAPDYSGFALSFVRRDVYPR